MGKAKGFTLIELIVVIAIIGILAVILVPSLIGYLRNSRASKMNADARSIFSGAQLAVTDVVNAGGDISPDTIYISNSKNSPIAYSGTESIDLSSYLGDDFGGYFGIITNSEGSGCEFAIWSESPLVNADIVQLSESEVKASLSTSCPKGCHPLK